MHPITRELKIVFIAGYALLVLAGWFIIADRVTPQVSAGITGNDLTGWAWSETVGWISFNSANCDLNGNNIADDPSAPTGCPTSGPIPNYGVTVDGSGFLSGHAWSEHIGWISFDASDVSGCPPGGGCVPRRVVNRLRGWARATAANPVEGWDGWISLSRVNCDTDEDGFSNGGAGCPLAGVPLPNYAVSVNICDYANYAWGSNVVGWISFNCANNGCGASSYKVTGSGNACGPAIAPLSVSCSGAPTPTTAGAQVAWTAIVAGGSGSYTITWHGTDSLEGRTGTPVYISYSSTGTKTGSVDVSDPFTPSVSQPCGSVEITPGIISFTANPTRVIKGDTSDITWTTNGFTDDTNCTLTATPYDGGAPPQRRNYTYTTPPLSQGTRYTLTCIDGPYSDSKFVDVSVAQPPQFKEVPPQ